MNEVNTILFIGLIAFLIWEIYSYKKYVAAANHLSTVGTALQAVFEGVVKDIEKTNENLTLTSIRIDRLDEATDTLNSNDALIEVYLNLFRDAIGLEAEKLNRIGTLKHPEPKE